MDADESDLSRDFLTTKYKHKKFSIKQTSSANETSHQNTGANTEDAAKNVENEAAVSLASPPLLSPPSIDCYYQDPRRVSYTPRIEITPTKPVPSTPSPTNQSPRPLNLIRFPAANILDRVNREQTKGNPHVPQSNVAEAPSFLNRLQQANLSAGSQPLPFGKDNIKPMISIMPCSSVPSRPRPELVMPEVEIFARKRMPGLIPLPSPTPPTPTGRLSVRPLAFLTDTSVRQPVSEPILLPGQPPGTSWTHTQPPTSTASGQVIDAIHYKSVSRPNTIVQVPLAVGLGPLNQGRIPAGYASVGRHTAPRIRAVSQRPILPRAPSSEIVRLTPLLTPQEQRASAPRLANTVQYPPEARLVSNNQRPLGPRLTSSVDQSPTMVRSAPGNQVAAVQRQGLPAPWSTASNQPALAPRLATSAGQPRLASGSQRPIIVSFSSPHQQTVAPTLISSTHSPLAPRLTNHHTSAAILPYAGQGPEVPRKAVVPRMPQVVGRPRTPQLHVHSRNTVPANPGLSTERYMVPSTVQSSSTSTSVTWTPSQPPRSAATSLDPARNQPTSVFLMSNNASTTAPSNGLTVSADDLLSMMNLDDENPPGAFDPDDQNLTKVFLSKISRLPPGAKKPRARRRNRRVQQSSVGKEVIGKKVFNVIAKSTVAVGEGDAGTLNSSSLPVTSLSKAKTPSASGTAAKCSASPAVSSSSAVVVTTVSPNVRNKIVLKPVTDVPKAVQDKVKKIMSVRSAKKAMNSKSQQSDSHPSPISLEDIDMNSVEFITDANISTVKKEVKFLVSKDHPGSKEVNNPSTSAGQVSSSSQQSPTDTSGSRRVLKSLINESVDLSPLEKKRKDPPTPNKGTKRTRHGKTTTERKEKWRFSTDLDLKKPFEPIVFMPSDTYENCMNSLRFRTIKEGYDDEIDTPGESDEESGKSLKPNVAEKSGKSLKPDVAEKSGKSWKPDVAEKSKKPNLAEKSAESHIPETSDEPSEPTNENLSNDSLPAVNAPLEDNTASAKPTKMKRYRCSWCTQFYATLKIIKNHDCIPRFTCEDCSPKRNFMSRIELADHLRSLHVYKETKCDLCKYKTGNNTYLMRHMRQVHDFAPLPEARQKDPETNTDNCSTSNIQVSTEPNPLSNLEPEPEKCDKANLNPDKSTDDNVENEKVTDQGDNVAGDKSEANQEQESDPCNGSEESCDQVDEDDNDANEFDDGGGGDLDDDDEDAEEDYKEFDQTETDQPIGKHDSDDCQNFPLDEFDEIQFLELVESSSPINAEEDNIAAAVSPQPDNLTNDRINEEDYQSTVPGDEQSGEQSSPCGDQPCSSLEDQHCSSVEDQPCVSVKDQPCSSVKDQPAPSEEHPSTVESPCANEERQSSSSEEQSSVSKDDESTSKERTSSTKEEGGSTEEQSTSQELETFLEAVIPSETDLEAGQSLENECTEADEPPASAEEDDIAQPEPEEAAEVEQTEAVYEEGLAEDSSRVASPIILRERRSRCEMCGTNFINRARLTEHRKDCVAVRSPPQATRRKPILTTSELNDYLSDGLGLRKPLCVKCGRTNYREHDLVSHTFRCRGYMDRQPKIPCPFCKKPKRFFHTIHNLDVHVRISHGHQHSKNKWKKIEKRLLESVTRCSEDVRS